MIYKFTVINSEWQANTASRNIINSPPPDKAEKFWDHEICSQKCRIFLTTIKITIMLNHILNLSFFFKTLLQMLICTIIIKIKSLFC